MGRRQWLDWSCARRASRWMLRLRTAVYELRRGAIRSLILRFLSAAYQACRLDRCYLRVYLFELSGALPPTPRCVYQLTVSELGHDEVSEYGRYRPECNPAEILQRLSAGERCFVGRHMGRIVCDGWWAFGEVHLPRL